MPLFELGSIVATKNALEFIAQHRIDMIDLLGRHVSGDWGELSIQDKDANSDAVSLGYRVFSNYEFKLGRIWVITEADRSSTCILLPEDY